MHSNRVKHSQGKQLSAIVRLWIFRMLIPLGGTKRLIRSHMLDNEPLAHAIGLGHWIVDEDNDFDPRAVETEMRRLCRAAESRRARARPPKTLAHNAGRLATLAGLTSTERQILEFAVLLHAEPLLEEAADTLGDLNSLGICRALATIIDRPVAEIRNALSGKGTLSRSGLVSLDRDGNNTLRRKIELLSDRFADIFISEEADPALLLKDRLSPCPSPVLSQDDYMHVSREFHILQSYLHRSLQERRRGVNILLYGTPGTGKTQLTRVLAHALSVELYEIPNEDMDGEPMPGRERLRAYNAAQCLLTDRRVLIAFDEIEDVFDSHSALPLASVGQASKSWVNAALENNTVPTFWISNNVDCLDASFLRRFDMVLELETPPRTQRERILRNECHDLLPEGTIAELAREAYLAPALVHRSAEVVRAVRSDLTPAEIPAALRTMLSNTLQAQGHNPLRDHDPQSLPTHYDPAYINTDTDLSPIAEGLQRSRAGRLCLYGPPGTGKTAYARWLAHQLGVALHAHTASDLLSPYVGCTEKHIARAFAEAERSGALLLIDEMDSFIQDRRSVTHGWETTQVNEMLTRIESFPGIFVATTNQVEYLDRAALRRFDLKIHFDYLVPKQAWALLLCQCVELQIGEPDRPHRARIEQLRLLTPGDFGAVARRHRLYPLSDVAAVIEALEAECAHKEGPRRRIGFVPS